MHRMVFFLAIMWACFSLAYGEKAPDSSGTAPKAPPKPPVFKLKSPAFSNLGSVPTIYTCDGDDISPPLSWKSAPANTQAFALVVSDPDAPKGTWYHWLVFNLPKTTQELSVGIKDADILPVGALIGRNSWEKTEYDGPCPPAGTMHRYIFTLYALDSPLSLSEGVEVQELLPMIQKHKIQQTQLESFYSRLPSR